MKEKTEDELKWQSYTHWQEYGDFTVQRTLCDYLDQPKVMIDDLTSPFTLEVIRDFPWASMTIGGCNTDNGVLVGVHIEYTEEKDGSSVLPKKCYDDSIGVGSPDNEGYVTLVVKLHTYAKIRENDAYESTQIVHVTGKNICETLDDLGIAMAELGRKVYCNALLQLDNPIPILGEAEGK